MPPLLNQSPKKRSVPITDIANGMLQNNQLPRSQRIQNQLSKASRMPKAIPSSFKKGGKVKKTGMAKVHKGEVVLTKEQVKKRQADVPRSGTSSGRGAYGAFKQH